ncbi:holin-associated N-acetylmuramidase [Paracoccus aestuariivivens]|uniref:Peptidoglycan-binding protein n=1 Tax=Paracoccus aestuariivivens TaxID=1820333 RepID=A0A6L6J9Q0_9RHOB|nr:holin-associated N-acetylmuramidase [Paracoccus aestuariivivens]MTH77469.1 peptidoglycan-binding protein [Paracoccus aestuariivivens]
MKTVEQIAAEIVAREGGYVNDPDDPGGPTNFGVTLATLRRLGLDRTGDSKIDLADLKAINKADAVRIFVDHYFLKPRLGELPAALQASVFDMQVNAGATAVKILQRLLSQMGFTTTDDGVVGPKTIEAARLAEIAARAFLADAYGIARRNYYYALADARPASRKFARSSSGGKGGWITRAEEFVSARYHLTMAEHQSRVAAWG